MYRHTTWAQRCNCAPALPASMYCCNQDALLDYILLICILQSIAGKTSHSQSNRGHSPTCFCQQYCLLPSLALPTKYYILHIMARKHNITLCRPSSYCFRQFSWSEDSQYIMYLQDVGGDENFHLYLQPLDGKPAKDLTDFEGVRAQNLVTDKHYPEEVNQCA